MVRGATLRALGGFDTAPALTVARRNAQKRYTARAPRHERPQGRPEPGPAARSSILARTAAGFRRFGGLLLVWGDGDGRSHGPRWLPRRPRPWAPRPARMGKRTYRLAPNRRAGPGRLRGRSWLPGLCGGVWGSFGRSGRKSTREDGPRSTNADPADLGAVDSGGPGGLLGDGARLTYNGFM